jgi:two-component system nitrogen regulation sensor histidine kinase NtrY
VPQRDQPVAAGAAHFGAAGGLAGSGHGADRAGRAALALARAARSGLGTSGRLHVRLVWLFSLIAAIPTLLVVIFASLLFQSGVEFWFSDDSRGMLENASSLARGYYADKLRDVGRESVAMAGDVRGYFDQAPITSQDFLAGYSWQVYSRKMDESAIIERARDGTLRTAAIVDPNGKDDRERITPDELRSSMPASRSSSRLRPSGSRR